MKKAVAVLCAVSMLAACANTGAGYRPLIDSKGVDFNRYEGDLRECQAYAAQVSGAAEQAMAGAVIGALLGAALGAAAGGNRVQRNQVSAVGALSGGVQAGAAGERDQRTVIRRCLHNRGYSVLQ